MKSAIYAPEGTTLKRRGPIVLPPLQLDRETREPLHRQLYRQLRRAPLPSSVPLPSTRALAAQLGVSRNTVLAAYEALAADGLLTAKQGSGTRWSRNHQPVPTAKDLIRHSAFPFDPIALHDPDGNPLYLHR